RGAVEISVSDNGPGIDAAVLDRLFEPFSTTKANGGGLGLAISRTIVQGHGGKLICRPIDTGGTCFELHIPRSESAIQ
ncbi:MAG: HAMP domain-containing sensor histidine kinase, partial [Steroidobacteraceae bacterium]